MTMAAFDEHTLIEKRTNEGKLIYELDNKAHMKRMNRDYASSWHPSIYGTKTIDIKLPVGTQKAESHDKE